MFVELVTPPTEAEILELVSVGDMRRELRITSNSQDEVIRDKILEAYFWLDGPGGVLNRCLLTQALRATLEGAFGELELKYPPIQSITAVEYLNPSSVWTSIPLSNFELPIPGTPTALRTLSSFSWPQVAERSRTARVAYGAGYGDADDVRAKARSAVTALKMLAAHLFHNREATVSLDRNTQAIQTLPFGLRTFVARLRIPNDHS